jgi:hypothetical protein
MELMLEITSDHSLHYKENHSGKVARACEKVERNPARLAELFQVGKHTRQAKGVRQLAKKPDPVLHLA